LLAQKQIQLVNILKFLLMNMHKSITHEKAGTN
jgi:hypothetical protein